MVILKKIKGATLMETLIATVLIMLIFVVSSLILNNLFTSSMKGNTRAISSKLFEIEYLYINDMLSLPYYDEYDGWDIEFIPIKNEAKVSLKATRLTAPKTIEKTFYRR
ncbi:type IV pilus modification PilV family protein [Winogradskyella tangerina]|uniref:type IV pilus modification PilV family protein n=1 Tax=Winogradskyella tangerina TaxID=2023240 RepID=UPI000DBE3C0B|nr:hypothetical protein [Winogradskyella tangerina]